MNNLLKRELNNRLKSVQQAIIDNEAEACIISSAINIYYLCDFIFDGYLYITPDSEPVLFVRRPQDINHSNRFYVRKPEQIPEYLREKGREVPKKIMLENDYVTYSMAERIKNAFKVDKLFNISGIMREIRSIKSPYEISIMKESAAAHTEVYKRIPTIFEQGMTDLDFQFELEYEMRKAGSMGIFRTFGPNMDTFMGTVLAGDNAQTPSPFDFALGGGGTSPTLPLGANGTPLRSGTTFMVDMAGNYRPVMDDMTRTFAIDYAPQKAKDAHQVSLEILRTIENDAKAGVPTAELYNKAEKIVKENKLEPYFMGTKQQARFIGHGVGLEINEPPVLAPRSRDILKTGMAIAIEPKFALPGIGPVGAENTYIIHDNHIENITLCDESLIVLK